MSQVTPGDRGSEKRAGSQAGKAAPAKRPPAKAAPKARPPATGSKGGAAGGVAKGRPPATRPKGRPPSGGGKGRPPTAGGAKGRAPRQNMRITAPPPRRFSPSTLAFASIAVVVVIVLVFVIVTVTKSNPAPSKVRLLALPTAASPAVVAQVTGVTPAVSAAVGLGSVANPPSVVKNQPPLTNGGKPEMLFIGAEFCPFSAAERWAMVVALSHFGTWSGLKETTSSPWDSDPDTATFSFRDATLTSNSIDFVSVEHETNDNYGQGTRALFQPLTNAQNNIWQKYSSQFGETPGYPFIDFGNKVFVTGPSYDPAILAGLSQAQIAAKLSNPADPVTQAIVGTANYLTAAICAETGNQPASVCSASGTHKAAVALKLS